MSVALPSICIAPGPVRHWIYYRDNNAIFIYKTAGLSFNQKKEIPENGFMLMLVKVQCTPTPEKKDLPGTYCQAGAKTQIDEDTRSCVQELYRFTT